MAADSLKNHFLLAMPGLAGSYFGATLTYVCEHSSQGAMGLMVNRPSNITLAELLSQLGITASQAAADIPVLEGGPVSGERGFILHTDDKNFSASLDLGNGLMLTTAREVLDAISVDQGPAQYLVTLGYAGWGAGQLEQEIGENSWLTCPANTRILFDVPFAERVNSAAATLGIDFRLMSGQAGHS
ncbi:MAG: YqgE/AlgH family protein [Gammaproteobacteria bacterium]|nr:YqgE/AlgH family protein [Gammaproteobacteria bacterium]